jgi:hypothetical protein
MSVSWSVSATFSTAMEPNYTPIQLFILTPAIFLRLKATGSWTELLRGVP